MSWKRFGTFYLNLYILVPIFAKFTLSYIYVYIYNRQIFRKLLKLEDWYGQDMLKERENRNFLEGLWNGNQKEDVEDDQD